MTAIEERFSPQDYRIPTNCQTRGSVALVTGKEYKLHYYYTCCTRYDFPRNVFNCFSSIFYEL